MAGRRIGAGRRASVTEEISGPVSSPVTMQWDSWGVPHIRAATQIDAYLGLGYAVASERLWQLDYMRRLARGELAAILGGSYVGSDRAMRTLGLGADADRDVGSVPEWVAEVLNAYASGINLWVERASALPFEFDTLGYRPAPWCPADSIAIWKYRWWTLTGRLENAALAEAAHQLLTPELAASFMATELADETIVPDGTGGRAMGSDTGEGSNNWVVGPSRTVSGKPVLCSDPHNAMFAPSQWFEAQLVAPGLDVIGATYCGTPCVYLGRNRDVAWGVTNHVAPVRDVYVEEVHPELPGKYLDGEDWSFFDVEDQTIEVAAGEDVRFRLRHTVRGAVISDHSDLIPAWANDLAAAVLIDDPELADVASRTGTSPSTVLVLKWVGNEPATGIDVSLALHTARGADDVLAALRDWPSPPLNFVYAAQDGRFGYHAASHIPRRGRVTMGFRDGNEPADVWNGTIPFDDLPQLADPERGWVATANNPPWSTTHPEYVGLSAWADGYRMRRIREQLTAKPKLTADEIAAVQAQVESPRAHDLIPSLLAILAPVKDRRVQAAAKRLAEWDRRFTIESVAATVFAAFWDDLRILIARERFPDHLITLAATQSGMLASRMLRGESIGWFADDANDDRIRQTFAASLARIALLAGDRMSGWRWGKLHTVLFEHPLAGLPGVPKLNTGPTATNGGPVVRAAGYAIGGDYRVNSGSTYRLVVDFGEPGRSRSVSTLGQSANPESTHYRDQTQLWLDNGHKPLWLDEADVKANLERTTVLKQERKRTR